jgi:glutamyl-tRNA synthetase
MDWGNAFVRTIVKSPSGVVTSLELELHLEGDFKKTKKKVHWLIAPSLTASPVPSLTPVLLKDYDYLITKKKLEDGDSVDDFLNPKTFYPSELLADAHVRGLKKGERFQFERKGYMIVDAEWSEEKGKVEVVKIPDGTKGSGALKWKDPNEAKKEQEGKDKAGKKKEEKSSKPGKEKGKEKADVQTVKYGLPDIAPNQAVESILKIGTQEIPVKTKMYKVDLIVDEGEVKAERGKMYEVDRIN